jgi:hypothetical protein
LRRQIEDCEKLRAGTLTPEERKAMLTETFEFLNEYAKQRRMGTGFDVKGKEGCTSTLLVLGLAWGAWAGWTTLYPDSRFTALSILYALFAIVCMGFIYTLYLILTDTRRYVRTELLPKLARALRPFKPTPVEINNLLERFRKRKFTLARNLTAGQIEEAIRRLDEAS